jgi:hypothetical protein
MTPTPNNVYVYISCFPQSLPVTYVIQTTKSPITSIVGETFKDADGNCWTYNGQYDAGYIVPPAYMSINYSGDYFATAFTTTYTDCETCISTPICYEYYVENINTETGHNTSIIFAVNGSYLCDGSSTDLIPVAVGNGICLRTTTPLPNSLALTPVWADGFIPLPVLGVDYTLTLNGCP